MTYCIVPIYKIECMPYVCNCRRCSDCELQSLSKRAPARYDKRSREKLAAVNGRCLLQIKYGNIRVILIIDNDMIYLYSRSYSMNSSERQPVLN